MTQAVLDALNKHFSGCELQDFSAGQIIIHTNQDPAGIFLLVSGVVEQYDISPEGNKLTVNVFRPPAFFPMSWAINKVPNAYFFSALTNVKLKRAGVAETLAFVRANPDVMFDLLSRVYKGTDALLRRLTLAASGLATNRLIFELLIEAYRFGKVVGDKKIAVKVKQNDLAARSGLARETVSRELHKLEQQNLVTKFKQEMVINVGGLENKLDFYM